MCVCVCVQGGAKGGDANAGVRWAKLSTMISSSHPPSCLVLIRRFQTLTGNRRSILRQTKDVSDCSPKLFELSQ